MSNIPGVTVTPKPVEVKSSAQSKTVWAIVAAAAVKILGDIFPTFANVVTPEVIDAAVVILTATAGIFLRKSVEDTKKAAAGAPVVKQ